MKLKFTRKTWYFFLAGGSGSVHAGRLCRAGRHGFFGAGTDRVLHHRHCSAVSGCTEGCASQADKRSYTLVFVLLMLSKLAAGGWAGDLCSALVWPGLLAIEYGHGRPIQRPLQLVCVGGGAAHWCSGC